MCAKVAAGMLMAVLLGTGFGWAQSATTRSAGYFSLEWEVGPTRSGQPAITGYVSNDFSLWAANIRLLVEALDSSGRAVASTIGYFDEWMAPKGRGYFYVPAPEGGVSYRVMVQSWSWRSPGR